MEMFNEASLLVMSLFLVPFSDYTDDYDVKHNAGFMFIAVMGLNFAINLGIVVIDMIKNVARSLRILKAKYQTKSLVKALKMDIKQKFYKLIRKGKGRKYELKNNPNTA